jgi:hypothetical protein
MADSSPARDDFEEFTLGTPDAVDQIIFEGPNKTDLGGVDADVGLKQIRLRIGRRPTVRNLRKVYEFLSIDYPKDLKLFDTYEVWLFSFNLHLMKDGGFQSVQQFGCQVKYPQEYAVSIVSLLPDSEFITMAGGQVKASATLSATGVAEVPTFGASFGGAKAQVGGGIHVEASADAKVNLSFSVMADKVIATGIGDFLSEWSIKRGDKPLLGEQQFLNAVLVPKRQKRLDVQVRAYVTVGTGYFIPARLNSEWVQMKISLDADAEIGMEGASDEL